MFIDERMEKTITKGFPMTDIQESLSKLRQASEHLDEKVSSDEIDMKVIEELQRSLLEVHVQVEELRQNVEVNNGSPLKYVNE